MTTIADKTRKQLHATITEVTGGSRLHVDSIVAAIESGFKVTKLAAPPRGDQPLQRVGQRWRNRTSGRLVRVTEGSSEGYYGQVKWECIDGSRGQKTGSVYASYWPSRFDYVDDGEPSTSSD